MAPTRLTEQVVSTSSVAGILSEEAEKLKQSDIWVMYLIGSGEVA